MEDRKNPYRPKPDVGADESLGILASLGIGLLYGIVMHIASLIMVGLYVLKIFVDNPWFDHPCRLVRFEYIIPGISACLLGGKVNLRRPLPRRC